MSAWILPDHIADVLPSEARHIEELRRGLLDTACAYGYELVMPPLLEHLDSLLSGSGEALDLLTFKLVDQLSGRTLGIRPDTTQQVARIDAHLLNRKGVTRLCYCGPVLHAKPDRPHATREPLQFGAEIYGHAGVEADVEVIALATQSLRVAQLHDFSVDLADVRIVQRLLAGLLVDLPTLRRVHAALAVKDASELALLTRDFPQAQRDGLRALLNLYGDVAVLAEAEKALAAIPGVAPILADLRQLADRIDSPAVTFDLADLRGYSYYSGMRFAIYAQGVTDALVRGGRYDEVGAAFGRSRPAVGFSLDIKQLVPVVEPRPLKAAIRAPWVDRQDMRQVIARLRQTGETVVCALPGHDDEVDEFNCDRELAEVDGQWIVRSI
ncbi:ATP phosphoribosyltransferase regulatory subunit [Comamonas sp. BIGb0152]|uniref:ATP phosphoribosyltransferase regulatory subunit n=1 Tax=Comamonas sp. BIGb0152 TaxID=2940601 RepID=UPI0021677435|nr:ATP phosphoribosyltransferase regulatory subunit [Comamonas sp. BIGb0152]MCS4295913.1 ATP phosphoribosyltransferase regulatory subunit [Comamonas sp. BIGb0152]